MPQRFIALCLAIPLLTVGCSAPEARLPPLVARAPASYLLGPGDQIRVSVFGLDAMTNTYRVDDSGAIALPIIGSVTVAGKSLRESEAAINEIIRGQHLVLDPKVSAQIIEYRPFFIAGQVQRPGQYPYVPGMSLITAVTIAGGYTFRADTRQATVTRSAQKARAGQESPILPGDLIMVPESWF